MDTQRPIGFVDRRDEKGGVDPVELVVGDDDRTEACDRKRDLAYDRASGRRRSCNLNLREFAHTGQQGATGCAGDRRHG